MSASIAQRMRALLCCLTLVLLCGCARVVDGSYVPVSTIKGEPFEGFMRLEFREGKVTIIQLPVPGRSRTVSEVRSFRIRGRRILLSDPPPRPDAMIYDPILEMGLEDDGSVVVGGVRFARKE